MKREHAYKFRIYPTEAQQRLLRRTFGCCRLVYNLALEQRRTFGGRAFGGKRRSITYNSAANELKALKAEAPFLVDAPHHCLQQTLHDLDDGFQRFFLGIAGYPKPRKKFANESCRFPDMAQVFIGRGQVKLPKLGVVKMRMHRPLRGKLNSITISLDGGMWFAAIQVTSQVNAPEPRPIVEGGADLNVVTGVVNSDGLIELMPRMSPEEHSKLARLQKAHSRKKKGSKNREKSRRAIAAFHARMKRRRKDAAHKISRHLADAYTHLAFENLKLKNLTASARGTVEAPGKNVAQKAGLNRALLDVALGLVRQQAKYKVGWAGGVCVEVVAAYTSQRCSECCKHPQDDVATAHLDNGRITRDDFICPLCGYAVHADVNAARNILALGREIWTADGYTAGGPPGAACGGLRGRRAGKQEQRSELKAA